MLGGFTRFIVRFVFCMNVVYFYMKSKEGEVYVPVFSLRDAVGMCKIDMVIWGSLNYGCV